MMSDRVVDALRALKDELLNSTTHHGYTATGFADAVNRHIAAAEQRAAEPTGPVVDAIRAALDAAVCDDEGEVLPPGTLAHLLAVAELDRDAPPGLCMLAQLVEWCEADETVIGLGAERRTLEACAAEARRLAAGPLPRVVHRRSWVGRETGCGGQLEPVPPEGVLLLPPSE